MPTSPTAEIRIPPGRREECLRRVDLALLRGCADEAIAAIRAVCVTDDPITPDCPMQSLGLPARIATILESNGISTVGGILSRTPSLLLATCRHIGPSNVDTIRATLKARGFDWPAVDG